MYICTLEKQKPIEVVLRVSSFKSYNVLARQKGLKKKSKKSFAV